MKEINIDTQNILNSTDGHITNNDDEVKSIRKSRKKIKRSKDKERSFIESKVDKIVQEQVIVNNIITKIDELIDNCDEKKKVAVKKFDEAKDSVAEAYGVLVENRSQIRRCNAEQANLQNAKETLYKSRLRLKVEDIEDYSEEDESAKDCEKIVTSRVISELSANKKMVDENDSKKDCETVEILVGEHECGDYLDRVIYSWLNPICRNYVLMENTQDFRFRDAKYSLEYKRDVVLMNKKVLEVIDRYPEEDNASSSIYYEIADPFLRKLQNKRGERELSNIIFSIQKQQTQIVMTPYDTNIVVQGCAGSGKSMIMLHRLPVLLYDNKTMLPRKQIAVITPSQLYIKMAQKMLTDLEIEDIYMDVVQEYYSNRIDLYEQGAYKKEIPKNVSRKKIDKKLIAYVYSKNVEGLINDCFAEKSAKIDDVMKEVYSVTGADKNSILKGVQNNVKDTWRKYSVYLSKTLRNEEKKHNDRSKVVKILVEKAKNLQVQVFRLCNDYKDALAKKEVKYNTMIYKHEHSKRELLEKNGEKAKSYKRYIGYVEDIENYTFIRNEVQKAICSFSENIVLRKQIEFYAEHLDGIIKEYESEEQLSFLEEDFIVNNIKKVSVALGNVKFLNKEQAVEFKCVKRCLQVMEEVNDVISSIQSTYETPNMYDAKDYIMLKSAYEEVKYMNENILQDTYDMVIDELRLLDDGLNTTVRYEFTYYLYLQIIYNFAGKLITGADKLVLIDEAQNFSSSEIDLINNVNGGVIFNLFGDINQHIELEKGLNSWNDLNELYDFEQFELNQNYRNVSQITEYCNSRFNMNMQPVNLEGKDVYTYNKSDVELHSLLKKVYKEKKKDYRVALIVKSMKDDLKEFDISGLDDIINKVKTRRDHIDSSKINIIEVDDAKGIEFDVVIVMKVIGMSQNEEYIACTRALEELLIYNCSDKMDIFSTQENILINEINNSISKERIESAKNKLMDVISGKSEKNKEYIIDTLFENLVPNKYAALLSIIWNSVSYQKFKQFVKSVSKWLLVYERETDSLSSVLNEMISNKEIDKYQFLTDEIEFAKNLYKEQKIS